MRGIAALLVAIIHALSVPDRMGAEPLVTYFWSIAPAGVDIFFVISGFIIATVAANHSEKSETTRFDNARQFLIKRFARIYPIYWIALTFFLVCYPSITIWGADAVPKLPLWNLYLLLDTNNYLLLAAWSLAYEVYFYIVLTIIILITPRRVFRSLLVWSIVSVALILVAHSLNEGNINYVPTSPLLIEFMLGAALAYIVKKNFLIAPVAALTVGLLWFVIGAELNRNVWMWHNGWRVLAFGPSSALIIYSVIVFEVRYNWTFARPWQLLGDASYSLYLWHQPLFYGLFVFFTVSGLRNYLPSWSLLPISLALIITIAFASFRFLERPLQKRIEALLLKPKHIWVIYTTWIGALILTMLLMTHYFNLLVA